ncbi:hypothetical protein LPB140_05080 [Sphingorhabdus lutea]|uniref:Beta-lactamase-related domain-containing protein n=1 Tax=Sphingorhabdus lutea TaxID=1913578 RepID=A0A1L3JEM4_9SPHN|nr:hypothetical protein LPB140_05080 [Sphingorhabdus lutea]
MGSSAFARRSFLALSAASAAMLAMPFPARAMAASDYPTVAKMSAKLVADKKIPNALISIGFGTGDSDVLAYGGRSFGDTSTVNMDSLWRVYSMTKPVTGMAAMILIGQGKLGLDQPISDFIPEFAEMRVLTDPENSLDSVPAKTQITVRHLLTHTAGLGYSIITKGPLLQEYLKNGILPGVVSRFPLPGFENAVPVPDIATFAKRLAKLPLIAEPGTKWSYSISLDLLGHVIGLASGMSFEAFLQENIFNPLGMNSTFFQLPADKVSRFVDNYAGFNGALIPIDPASASIYLDKPAFAFGGAGLISSARDFDRFLTMLANGGKFDDVQVMDSDMVKLGMSNLLPEGVVYKGFNNQEEPQGFGAGGRAGIGANAGQYGWGGAAGTVAAVDTKSGMRLVGMTQLMTEKNPFQNGLTDWVLTDLRAKMMATAA